MAVFEKQPGDVLDYDVDLTEWFKGIPGDDIESVEVSITAASESIPTLVAGPSPHPVCVLLGANPKRFKIWLGGGQEFMDYKVTCRVLTEQDRVKEVEFKIKVRDR